MVSLKSSHHWRQGVSTDRQEEETTVEEATLVNHTITETQPQPHIKKPDVVAPLGTGNKSQLSLREVKSGGKDCPRQRVMRGK
ncbi:hypothetical protein RRG08_036490 [Elysia crispata]|uniref:Uncharacterized protein n=1 Tax=Elysia crispata TaxID=231223 RepID=A0AAE0ZLC8_9GAST|nr:hypothetical protein RRG08_036490 [Elysia crispata]